MSFMARHEKRIVTSVSWAIFLLCSVGLAYFVHLCIDQYLSYPQGIDISSHPQHQIDFPSFTFCSLQAGRKFKLDELISCGFSSEKELKKRFNGTGSPDCEDPEKFWSKIALDLVDMGIKKVEVKYIDETSTTISIDEANEAWSKMITQKYGTCFMLSIPKALRTKDIRYMFVSTQKALNKELIMVVHEKDQINPLGVHLTPDFTFSLFKKESFIHDIKFVKKLVLEPQCQPDKSYSLTDCIKQQLDEVGNEFLMQIAFLFDSYF